MKRRSSAKPKVNPLSQTLEARKSETARLINTGAWAEAFASAQQALSFAPQDPEALVLMAILLRVDGRLRDAVLHCDAALQVAPNYAEAWLQRGYVLAAGGSMDAARECYLQVVQLQPANADALAGLASLAARDGKVDEGRDYGERALAADPDNVIAACALSTIDLEQKEPLAAKERLEPILAKLETASADRSMAFGLLGDALSALGGADDAFNAYARSKADFAEIHAAKTQGREPHRAMVERITKQIPRMAGMDCSVTTGVANAASNHVFLLGYPRSGTTLVENILASLPDVLALEERPTLGFADHDFLLDEEGLARFAALDDASLNPYRQAYWNKVFEAGLAVAGKTFVDMDPLKATRLPLIARLFPQAKILIMRRDPRDCVWSCFHTNFALTSASLEFTTLECAARHYDAMMRLIEVALTHLPITPHIVRYDALVRDFDTETRAMCDFVGVPWRESIRDFDRTAQARGVSTASAGQVRKGLYDGSRRWEVYKVHMENVAAILQPWVDKFGY